MRNMKKALLGLTAAAMLAGSCVSAPSVAAVSSGGSGGLPGLPSASDSESFNFNFSLKVEDDAKWSVNLPVDNTILELRIKDKKLKTPLALEIDTTVTDFNLNGDTLNVKVDSNSMTFTNEDTPTENVTLNLYTDAACESQLNIGNAVVSATDTDSKEQKKTANIYGKLVPTTVDIAGKTFTGGSLTFTVSLDENNT